MPRKPLPLELIRSMVTRGDSTNKIAKAIHADRWSIWRVCILNGIPVVGHAPAVRKPERKRKVKVVPPDPMFGVRFLDDPRASRPMAGSLPHRQFEWTTL